MKKKVLHIFELLVSAVVALVVFSLLFGKATSSTVDDLSISELVELPSVKIDSKDFKIEDKIFRFIGANAVNLVFYDDFNLSVESAIKTAKESGISVLRLFMDWGWGKAEDYDKILDIASREGIYVILTLTDFQSDEGSKFQRYYRKHAGYGDFLNADTKKRFKKWIEEVINRKNSVNGKIYKDDTTIFAWDIGNEPEYRYIDYSKVSKWIQEIAIYIKSLDPNHLVTIGIDTHNDDFDSNESLYKMLNVKELDFFSFHFYPVPRGWKGGFLPEGYTEKINFRTKKFISMGKPVVMEEFGFSVSGELNAKVRSNSKTRDIYYNVLRVCMDSAFASGASGAMFWGWGIPEAKDVSLWWSIEDHNASDEEFLNFIKEYRIPISVNVPE